MKPKFVYSILISASIYFNMILCAQAYDCFSNPVLPLYYQQNKPNKTNAFEDDLLLQAMDLAKKEILYLLKLNKNKTDREKLKQELYVNCSEILYHKSDNYVMPHNGDCLSLQKKSSPIDQYELLHCDVNKTLRRSPIKVDDYVDIFNQAIHNFEASSDKKVFMSSEHTWDSDTQRERIIKHPLSAIYSKLLLALSIGVTSRYLMTSKDSDLAQFLESATSSSVTPQKLLEKSLELQEGDLYLALLSIENVLSRHWTDKDRGLLKQTDALESIIYHCPSDKEEDKFGAWYHLFGLMLYGCIEGGVKASTIGRIENAGSRVLDVKSIDGRFNKLVHMFIGSDPQEEKIGRRAGKIGHRLCLPYKK